MATTGTALLQDVGSLVYNGASFSQLYTSTVSGEPVLDSAGRTVKYMRYTITVDGVVTLENATDATIDRQFVLLRERLTQSAGFLKYTGKGFGSPFTVNQPGGTVFDVAWGPIPKVLEFIPLGGARSAMIKWQVTTCIPEVIMSLASPIAQFCFSTGVTFDNDGYSSLTFAGSFEIGLTRPTQTTVTLTETADDFRTRILSRITSTFDLTRFKVVNRQIDISEDKRTLTFHIKLTELAPMGIPAGVMTAGGEFTFAPEKPMLLQSMVNWVCTLRATYNVPPGFPRRLAWFAFVAMWRFRMAQSQLGGVPSIQTSQNAVNLARNFFNFNFNLNQLLAEAAAAAAAQQRAETVPTGPVQTNDAQVFVDSMVRDDILPAGSRAVNNPGFVHFNQADQAAMPISLTGSEGLYEDSKTVTFEAKWRLRSTVARILWSTGLWRRSGLEGGDLWATSVRPISGPRSWLENKLDPSLQAIVDFGNPG